MEPAWRCIYPMKKMNVLIVDDQINVVSGVMFGVHWDHLWIEQVYKAYNAYEAKQILQEKQVDIMLCDIEMPVENGLSLLAAENGCGDYFSDGTCGFSVCQRGGSTGEL